MTVPSLQINFPFPFSKTSTVTIHPSQNSRISDVINLAINLAKEKNQIYHEEYGLFLSGENRWFLPEAKVESYKEVFINLNENQELLLLPKKIYQINFFCFHYKVTIQCGLEQKLRTILKHVIFILGKQLPEFFTGNDWVIVSTRGEIPDTAIVKDIISIGNCFFIRKAINRRTETDLPVFSEGLENALARDGPTSKIPSIVLQLFKRIEQFIQAEGIFRKSGGQTIIEGFCKQIDETSDKKEIERIINGMDVHSTTSVLKSYFRNIKDPLIPYHFYPSYEEIINLKDGDQRKTLIRQLLNTMPEPNFQILGRFMKCLTRVLDNSEQNKMSIASLSICVSAIIVRNPSVQSDPIATQSTAQAIITDLIRNEAYYFRNAPLYDNSLSAMCVKSVRIDPETKIHKGEVVPVLEKKTEKKKDILVIKYNDKEANVSSSKFKLVDQNLFEVMAFTEVKDDVNYIRNNQNLFVNHPSIPYSQVCNSHLSKLNKELQEKTKKIQELCEKLKGMEDCEEKTIILAELSALIDTSFI